MIKFANNYPGCLSPTPDGRVLLTYAMHDDTIVAHVAPLDMLPPAWADRLPMKVLVLTGGPTITILDPEQMTVKAKLYDLVAVT